MPAFEIRPRSKPDGDFAAAWFDDDVCLWNDARLTSPKSMEAQWTAPELKLVRPELGATPVLFNPNAIAVSKAIRTGLAQVKGLEFLPVSIASHEEFYVLHVTCSIELPAGCDVRVAPAPSNNVVEIFSFPPGFIPPAGFFRVLHPIGSSARRTEVRAIRAVYAGLAGMQAIRTLADQYLEARPK